MIVALICLGVVLVLAVLWALGTTDMHRASCVVLAAPFVLVGIGAALGALVCRHYEVIGWFDIESFEEVLQQKEAPSCG